MRRRLAVAGAALIAVLALAALPVPAGSTSPSVARDVQSAAFTSVTVSANAPALKTPGTLDAAFRSDGYVSEADRFVEPGRTPRIPKSRPRVNLPATSAVMTQKPPKYSISGYATFYYNGTTAMRLPRGTVVRICGDGGCIERTVNDYGPQKTSRVVDLYKPDFFAICGCASWAGTTWVTVAVY